MHKEVTVTNYGQFYFEVKQQAKAEAQIRTNMLLGNIKEVVDAGRLGEYSSLVKKPIEE